MKKTLVLEVIGCNPAKLGHNYVLSLNAVDTFKIGDRIPVTYDTGGISREGILSGIERVFGFNEDELCGFGSDAQHTYARKVYAQLRRDMGVGIGDIANELKKANASVAYYLTDNSTKVREYCDAVRNG